MSEISNLVIELSKIIYREDQDGYIKLLQLHLTSLSILQILGLSSIL